MMQMKRMERDYYRNRHMMR
jgi:hypothetical protein